MIKNNFELSNGILSNSTENIFRLKTSPVHPNDIPLLLNFPATNSKYAVQDILLNCFGLRGMNIQKFEKNPKEV